MLRKIIVAAALALSVCGLFGCAASASNAAFVGTWVSDAPISQQGKAASNAELSQSVTLTVAESGAVTLDVFGIEQEGALKVKSANEATVEIESASSAVTVDGDKLSLEHDGTSIVFKRQ